MPTAKTAVRKVVGRASGKAKPGMARGVLSQALILRTALNIIDELGLNGLTVRKLAEELGVSAMAIYRHYRSKAEIEQQIVDLVVGDYDVTNHQETDWREWIYVTYSGMRSALCAHPGVMPLLDDASYQGGRALTVMDRILQELEKAGLSAEQSATLFHMLMANMIGSVVLMNADERRRVASRMRPASQRAGGSAAPVSGLDAAATDYTGDSAPKLSFEAVNLEDFPHIVALVPQLLNHSNEQRFRQAVMLIIRAMTG